MTSNFITPQEVLDIAFDSKNMLVSKIPDIKIRVAELSWIRPVITQDLFDRLNRANTTLTADEIILKGKLKEPLAFFTKFECLPDINVQTTNKGAQIPQTNFSEGASSKDREQQILAAKRQGEILMADIVRWIEDEDNISKFSTYYNATKNVINRSSTRGGIIGLKKRIISDPYNEQ